MAKINCCFQSCLILLIRLYQKILSPFLGSRCRFFPSCSQYALEAISAYGIVRGLYAGFKRVMRCNPFCKGGFDPVDS